MTTFALRSASTCAPEARARARAIVLERWSERGGDARLFERDVSTSVGGRRLEPLILVDEETGECVGCALAIETRGGRGFEDATCVTLESVIVAEKARGKGLGTMLISRAVEYAQTAAGMDAEVVTVHCERALLPFYSKNGMFELEPARGRDREDDEVIMRSFRSAAIREAWKRTF